MVGEQFVDEVAGGALIGLAGAILLLGLSRVAGVSGILGGLVTSPRGDLGWRVSFLGGLAAGGLVLSLLAPGVLAPAAGSLAWVAGSGLLVGAGTRLGNGCTSGHGVSGISRLSPRSLVATLVFMQTGALAVGAVRHWFGGDL